MFTALGLTRSPMSIVGNLPNSNPIPRDPEANCEAEVGSRHSSFFTAGSNLAEKSEKKASPD